MNNLIDKIAPFSGGFNAMLQGAAQTSQCSRAPLVRQLCASTTGNNRIQPDCEPLEQAESQ